MERIRACIRMVFPGCDAMAFSADMPLGQIDGWDSMSSVTFLLELETAFGVRLAGLFLTETQTLADIAELLAQRGAIVEFRRRAS